MPKYPMQARMEDFFLTHSQIRPFRDKLADCKHRPTRLDQWWYKKLPEMQGRELLLSQFQHFYPLHPQMPVRGCTPMRNVSRQRTMHKVHVSNAQDHQLEPQLISSTMSLVFCLQILTVQPQDSTWMSLPKDIFCMGTALLPILGEQISVVIPSCCVLIEKVASGPGQEQSVGDPHHSPTSLQFHSTAVRQHTSCYGCPKLLLDIPVESK